MNYSDPAKKKFCICNKMKAAQVQREREGLLSVGRVALACPQITGGANLQVHSVVGGGRGAVNTDPGSSSGPKVQVIASYSALRAHSAFPFHHRRQALKKIRHGIHQ